MPTSPDPPIVISHSVDAGHWTASFEDKAHVTFGGNTAFVAIRRLLEMTEAGHGTYSLTSSRDPSATGQIPESVIWDPPELLVSCPDCNGRGEYVGLLQVEKCKNCGGRCRIPC